MVTAVVDVRPLPASAASRRISRVASETQRQASPFQPHGQPRSVTPQEDLLIAQLGRLASQHHTSEYNRLKFGPDGSPLVYVPYSVQMPDHYREMQTHQSCCAKQEAWWPHERELDGQGTSAHSARYDDAVDVPASTECTAVMDLREQLSAALSSSIVPLSQVRADALVPQPHWQTSETHPIVISTIIPPELLPTVSSQLRMATGSYPVIMNVPPSQTLDRLISTPAESVATKPSRCSVPPAPTVAPHPTPALSSAHSLAKSLKLSSLFWVHPTVRRAFLADVDTPIPTKRARPLSVVGLSLPRLDVNLSNPVRPKVVRNCSSSALPGGEPKIDTSHRHAIYSLRCDGEASNTPVPAVPSIPPLASAKLVGNLYMSSCPGKKVRLDGPVRGRNTVCRDLRSDLCRIKGVGVACIICCLDDNELQSLGVTWSDYVRIAGDLGINVLRIPIPEGLAPLDAEALDSHLNKVIHDYTLRGTAVLVHCRGGVGRAGIIACCWMLKLGLCGWLHRAAQEELDWKPRSELGPVDDETFRLIERLISVVRRRRSPKAIETYEQVKFLVDYVDFLRERAASPSARSSRSFSTDLFADWTTSVE
ncbi:protein-tyrosine phosphatase-like protein [Daedaleopsis nitida]|nr:protein-tyrosine phosphatase-like protein [Daedaleopsis nitida]